MPPRERIHEQQVQARAAVEPYLEPGERAVVVLTGQQPKFWFTGIALMAVPLLGMLVYLIIYRVYYLVVTDQGVLVVEMSKQRAHTSENRVRTPKGLVWRGFHADMQLGRIRYPGVVTAQVGDKSYTIFSGQDPADLITTARETLGVGAGSTSAA